ncbi:MAG: lipoate--protein ligase [Clostridia bacterium]|nr:lipoate--protein ligase [Clostridia bacterium]
MNHIICTHSTDPYYNLALEELLFEREQGFCLYLWQNKNTVVIGRNQNAWKECSIDMLEAEGGRLARRSSGGGAVFHDMGNLNFTFIAPIWGYDIKRQLGVIIKAVQSLGIEAEFTGRNDIVTAAGTKFSGNAFRKSNTAGMHHGTLLLNVDMDKLSRYLLPSPAKLAAKGVDSVRARVANLAEYRPSLTIHELKEAVAAAFIKEYGESETLSEGSLDRQLIKDKTARYSSWEWNKGASPAFDLSLSNRFPWGELTLELSLEKGRITRLHPWSDAMDEALVLALPAALEGCRLDGAHMAKAVSALNGPEAYDIARWLKDIRI